MSKREKRFRHPLLYAQYAAVPERQELARCCLGGERGKPTGRKLSDAWVKVEEQPAAPGSTSSRYTAGVRDLGTVTLFSPTFDDPASRQHGLWGCAKCVRKAAADAVKAENEAAAAMLSLASSSAEQQQPPRAPAPQDMQTRAAAAQQEHLSILQQKEKQQGELGRKAVASARRPAAKIKVLSVDQLASPSC